ncbi:hypothetical protein FOL46_001442 [Perkinsus olseni]|uniref:Uncharacterized protein n=1 Tax=Perkinsus olseni TaxID=32597 RepID=A0A7J6MD44_PEROL|nr:hypothetical protein FOL46_001442 [Perkinsus olseni]
MCDFDSCLAEVDLLGGASSGAAADLMDLKAVGRRKRPRRELKPSTLETTRELDDYNKQSFGGWGSNRAEAPVLTGRFDCQYTAQVTQKRKRYQEGVLVLCGAGVSLCTLEDDEVVDSAIWSYTLRRDWNKAQAQSATLEMLLQRHIARVQFGSGEGGLIQGTGCVAAGCQGGPQGLSRGSVNVGVVSADMFRSAAAIESRAFGGLCRPPTGTPDAEDGEFEAILRKAQTRTKHSDDGDAPLLLKPSRAPPQAPSRSSPIREVREDVTVASTFPPYRSPTTPFDLLDMDFVIPCKSGDAASAVDASPVAVSMRSYALLWLDTIYRALHQGVRDLATGLRPTRSAAPRFKACPLGSTCKLKMTDKGEARLYFPGYSKGATKKGRGGSKLFFKSSTVRDKETRIETPDVFLFLVKGKWVVYASTWRGLNPQGLLQVRPLTETTRMFQEGLVVGSTLACSKLHCLEGVGHRLQYLQTIREVLSTKGDDGSSDDSEGDLFNAGSGSRASLDPWAICCTSLCLFRGQGSSSSHRLLGRALSLPAAVDLDDCMAATMTLFPGLNSEQVAVLEQVRAWFSDSSAEPLIMVQGVYGSGKTTVLAAVMALLYEILVASCGPVVPVAHRRVGLLSLTNVAVDNVLLKLKSKGLQDFVRLGVHDRIAVGIRDEYFARTQSRVQKEGPPGLSVLEWKARAIVAATLASAADLASTIPCPFVVIDECSQVTEPTLMLPLMRSVRPVRMLMFGDPRQLPPPPDDCPIKAPTGSTSVMKLIAERHAAHPGGKLMHSLQLRTQYRCHPDISAICSTLFYDGQVTTQYTPPAAGAPLPGMPAVIALQYNSSSPPQRRGDSLYHPGEADLVASLVQRLYRRTQDISVICMYKAMVQEVKDRDGTSVLQITEPVTVATVDSFQGSEASIVIVVLTYQRSSSGCFGTFISDPQRANVAISRARDHIVVVGHETAFHRSSTRSSASRHSNVAGACPVLRLSLEFGLEDPISSGFTTESREPSPPGEPGRRGYLWLLAQLAARPGQKCPVSVPEVIFFQKGVAFRMFAMGGESASILTMTAKRPDGGSDMRTGVLLKKLYNLERKRYAHRESHLAKSSQPYMKSATPEEEGLGQERRHELLFKDCDAVFIIRYVDGAIPGVQRTTPISYRYFKPGAEAVMAMGEQQSQALEILVRDAVGRIAGLLSTRWTILAGIFDFEFDALTDRLWLVGASQLQVEGLMLSPSDDEELPPPVCNGPTDPMESEDRAAKAENDWDVIGSPEEVDKWLQSRETELGSVAARWNYQVQEERDRREEQLLKKLSAEENVTEWVVRVMCMRAKLQVPRRPQSSEWLTKRQSITTQVTGISKLWPKEDLAPMPRALQRYRDCAMRMGNFAARHLTKGDEDIGREDLMGLLKRSEEDEDDSSHQSGLSMGSIASKSHTCSNSSDALPPLYMPQLPLRLASVLGFRALDPPAADTMDVPEPPKTRRRRLSGPLSSWIEIQYTGDRRQQPTPPCRESFQNPSWIPAQAEEVTSQPFPTPTRWAPGLGMNTANPSQWILAKIYYPLFHQVLMPVEYLAHTASLHSRYLPDDDAVVVDSSSIDPDTLLTEESFSIVDDSDDSDWDEL